MFVVARHLVGRLLGDRDNDFDPVFAFVDPSSEGVPEAESGYSGGVGSLGQDEEDVAS